MLIFSALCRSIRFKCSIAKSRYIFSILSQNIIVRVRLSIYEILLVLVSIFGKHLHVSFLRILVVLYRVLFGLQRYSLYQFLIRRYIYQLSNCVDNSRYPNTVHQLVSDIHNHTRPSIDYSLPLIFVLLHFRTSCIVYVHICRI